MLIIMSHSAVFILRPVLAEIDWPSQIVTGLIALFVPLVIAIPGFLFYRLLGSGTRRIIRTHGALARDACGLYVERVNIEERVPPEHLLEPLRHRSTRLPTVPFFMLRELRHISQTEHVLLVYRKHRNAVGLLKAMYLPALQAFFIAYLVVDPQEPPRQVARRLLKRLRRYSRFSRSARRLYFEVVSTEGESRASRGKIRLFTDHATALGYSVRKLPIQYVQPCLDPAADPDEFLPGTLLEIRPAQNRSKEEPVEACHVVHWIYEGIYQESFLRMRPESASEYQEHLDLLKEFILTDSAPEGEP